MNYKTGVKIDVSMWCGLLIALWAWENPVMDRVAITIVILFNIALIIRVSKNPTVRKTLLDWDE